MPCVCVVADGEASALDAEALGDGVAADGDVASEELVTGGGAAAGSDGPEQAESVIMAAAAAVRASGRLRVRKAMVMKGLLDVVVLR
ncbi:hypothetical protein GCM10022204_11630 [Microlunatus aurantiacus]|uniref:Uncharacterized protein n=1 Tax=Microlunatus aurantiacus TaxID=446786 RepID=A0ABP7CZZ3_9ACTN